MADSFDTTDFAVPHDGPIPYLRRITSYYLALGYETPYRWAQYADVPFQPLEKPLADCRLSLVTTAAPYRPELGDQGPGAPYNSAAKFYKVYTGDIASAPDLRISHLGIDRAHTTAEDMGSWFPLEELRRQAAAGRIGSLAPRFIGAPTNRSQKTTIEQDGPDILAAVREDGSEAALIVAN